MHKHFETSFFVFADGSIIICDDHVEFIEQVIQQVYPSDEAAYEAYSKLGPFVRGYYFENSHEFGLDFRFMEKVTSAVLATCKAVKQALSKDYGVERIVTDGADYDI